MKFRIMDSKFIDKLAFIEIRERKVLVSLSKGKDVWYIPGGKRGVGESDEQALVREVREELSVEIDSQSVKLYGVFTAQAQGKPVGVMVRMSCYTGSYAGMLKASAEIVKYDYFSYFQRELCSEVDKLIFKDLEKKGLID